MSRERLQWIAFGTWCMAVGCYLLGWWALAFLATALAMVLTVVYLCTA